mmetsp:Transcript_36875/g.115431  ORF Transcript_36875/g.115431 Transcript_36875/m.115431 type:complete len:305 (-) Transcript_36875:1372-2286(-)
MAANGGCELAFGEDANGEEVLVMRGGGGAGEGESEGGGAGGGARPYKGSNRVVMMEWERPYMERLVEALGIGPGDGVLEIGFGCGYSAVAIQEQAPAWHTIVECDATVLARAHRWAENEHGVRIVEGTWQAALAARGAEALGPFSAVFFDDFPSPLPGAATPETASLTTTRWHALLKALRGVVAPGARVTGYMARDLEAAEQELIEGLGVEVVGMERTRVEPSKLCPYFQGHEMYVPAFRFPGGEAKADPGKSSAAVTALAAAGDGERPSKRVKRTELRLPPPTAQAAARRDAAAADPSNDNNQ